MTDILGHDINGRPLMAWDEVVLLSAEDEWSSKYINKTIAVTGLYEIEPEYMTTDAMDDSGMLIVDGPDVRKLTDDHRPADESFSEMMVKLKTNQLNPVA